MRPGGSSGASNKGLGGGYNVCLLLGCLVLAVVSFALGFFHAHGKLDPQLRSPGGKGSVGSIKGIDFQKLGREADLHGQYIMQQVMLPYGQVPHITSFSRAVLRPKQMLQRHAHRSLHEVYYVEQGHGVFLIDDEPHIISAGHFIHVAPGEPHSVLNHTGLKDDHAEEDLVLIYFGVVSSPSSSTITIR